MDPDGVSTLFLYNDEGEVEYTVLDVNRNGAPDWSGPDRITRTAHGYLNNGSANVRQTKTWVWSEASQTSNVVSMVESSVDGRTNWTTSYGLTTRQELSFVATNGQRTVRVFPPVGVPSTNVYEHGRLVSASRGILGGTTYTYDGHARAIRVTDARTGAVTNWYDAADRLVATATPAPGSGLSSQVTSFEFDPAGRLTNTLHPDGLSTTNHYFVTGLPKKTAGARTYPVAYVHDHAGRMKTMTTWTDAATGAGSAVTTWNYDGARGWLTNKVYADGKGPGYTNTAAGRLALRKWARGTNTTYTYNNAGELSGVDYSDPATPDVTYVYDRLGRQTTNVQGSITTTRAYDLPGNLLSEKYSGGPLNGLTVSNNYDGYFRRVTNGLYNGSTWLVLNGYTYDASNRLSVVTDGTNSATYAYLANSGLIDRVTFQQNGNTRMVTAKAYDNLNRLTAIVSSNNSAVVLASFHYAYNLANQRTAVTNADSTRWGFGYDFLGQVNSGKKYWSDASVIAGQQFEYGFDDIGNREYAASGGNEWGTGLRYQHYTANNLNQYTQRTVPGGVDVLGAAHSNATVTVNLQPTYRKGEYFRGEITTDNSTAARWLSLTNVGVLANITPTITNDILSTNIGQAFIPKTPEVFAHDKDGNLITNGQWLLTWDAENRLVGAESITSVTNSGVPRQKLVFAYDTESRRTSKIVSNWVSGAWQLGYEQRFAYDGWNPIAILSSSATVIQSLLWGSDLSGTLQGAGGVGGLLAVNDATNGAHFCAYDGNGNVSALASAADGTETARYEFGPFGELLRASGQMATANSFLFSTKFQDWETGFYYYGYRYYDPTVGRWLNRDPLGEVASKNLYGFLDNNGIDGIDPDGLWEIWPKARCGNDFHFPLGPLDIYLEPCEVVIVVTHGVPGQAHRFHRPRPPKGCENCSVAKGAFLGCWANATNVRIPEGMQVPGAPDWEDTFQGHISVEGDSPEDIRLRGLKQLDQQAWSDAINNLKAGALAAAQQIIRCCCECPSVSVTWIVIDKVRNPFYKHGSGKPYTGHRDEKGIIAVFTYIVNADGTVSR